MYIPLSNSDLWQHNLFLAHKVMCYHLNTDFTIRQTFKFLYVYTAVNLDWWQHYLFLVYKALVTLSTCGIALPADTGVCGGVKYGVDGVAGFGPNFRKPGTHPTNPALPSICKN